MYIYIYMCVCVCVCVFIRAYDRNLSICTGYIIFSTKFKLNFQIAHILFGNFASAVSQLF